jgi:hypothetical protein
LKKIREVNPALFQDIFKNAFKGDSQSVKTAIEQTFGKDIANALGSKDANPKEIADKIAS